MTAQQYKELADLMDERALSEDEISKVIIETFDEYIERKKREKEEDLPMTSEGYKAAKIYLKAIGETNAINNELSTDGYTLIHLANSFRNKREKERDEKELLRN